MDTPLPAPTPGVPAPTPGVPLPTAPLPEPTDFTSTFLIGGVLLTLAFALLMFFFVRSMSRQQAIRKTEPLPEVPKIGIAEGWYPTPDDLQERYHNGEEWTAEYRPRADAATEVPVPEEAPLSPEPAERSEP